MEDMGIETMKMKTKKGSPEMCLREMTMGLKLNITMIGLWRTWAERIINIRFPWLYGVYVSKYFETIDVK